jgi:hypothetical protein
VVTASGYGITDGRCPTTSSPNPKGHAPAGQTCHEHLTRRFITDDPRRSIITEYQFRMEEIVKKWVQKARLLAGALTLSLVSILAMPSTPAFALNGVACNETGYLRIWFWSYTSDGFQYKSSYCFANAGEDDQIYIREAVHLHSGNNAGYVILDNGGVLRFGKWWDGDISPEDNVNFIHID